MNCRSFELKQVTKYTIDKVTTIQYSSVKWDKQYSIVQCSGINNDQALNLCGPLKVTIFTAMNPISQETTCMHESMIIAHSTDRGVTYTYHPLTRL